jgi:hypothetical protein
MLTIEILEGTNVAERITIGKPTATDDGQNFSCALQLEGMRSMPVFGVTPLDALENAMTAAKGSAAKLNSPTWRVI